MIRKSGLLVFIALLATVFVLVYVFLGFAIRLSMVYTLEKAVGAEVNIKGVSVSLAPLAVRIDDLQITDKHQPTHNSVSFTKANAELELWPALLGYYVVKDLSLDGLAFGSARKRPGKVYRSESTDTAEPIDLESVLKLDLPDANELMARVNLQSTQLGKELQDKIAAQRQAVENLKARLPKKETLEDIQRQIKELTESKVEDAADLARKTQQLKELQDRLKQERDNVGQVQQELAQMREDLRLSVGRLRAASTDDWQRIQQLANLSEGGLAPLSQILLGDFWGSKIAQLESLYRLVKPYIPEQIGSGTETVEEPEPTLPNRILPLPNQPYPDFWIKNARVHWLIGGGDAVVQFHNITTQHSIINTETRFHLSVAELPRLVALEVNGDFAILEEMVTNLSWRLDGLALEPVALGSGDTALSLTQGMLMSAGELNLHNNQLTQQAQVLLRQPKFAPSNNRYMQQLVEVLDRQDQIPLQIAAHGLLSKPDISVRSSLDRVIGEAILGEARTKIADLEKQLRGQLDNKLSEQLGAHPEWLTALTQQESELEGVQQNIQEMLSAKLSDATSSAKDRLKDSLLKRAQ